MKLVAALALLVAALPVLAQNQVWRCGAEGRVVYSDTPCADGRAVAVDDGRSAADQRAAREVAARDRALAHTMTAERHEREREIAAERGSGITGIVTPTAQVTPKKAKAKGPKKHPPADADTFRAIAPVSLRTPG